MGNESIEASFLSVFALISFFIFLLTSKYSHKFKSGILLDEDFVKPQAFHEQPTTRSGGIAIMFSLFTFFGIYYLLFSEILYGYIFLSSLIFFVGFFHAKISLNEIYEDYIHNKKIKDVANLLALILSIVLPIIVLTLLLYKI